MTTVRLGANAIGIEHAVDAGSTMTGVVSADTNPNYINDREVIQHAQLAGNGEGLVDPHPYISSGNPYCTFAQIISTGAVNWSVYVTSGMGDGDATTIDDPSRDQEIATGTGNAHIRMNVELLPGQFIRVISGAAGADPMRVIIHFVATLNCGGRLIS